MHSRPQQAAVLQHTLIIIAQQFEYGMQARVADITAEAAVAPGKLRKLLHGGIVIIGYQGSTALNR